MPDDKKSVVMTTRDPYNIRNYNPFIYPVPIPTTDSITNMICVKIARAWLPIVRGALQTILWKDVYVGTTEQQKTATMEASRLLSFLNYEDRCMLTFRNKPDDTCIIQTSDDGGQTWLDGWDMSLCVVSSVTKIYRFNPVTNIYEVSIDAGVTFIDATSEDPRFTQPQSPPATGPDALCKMAQDAVENWQQWTFDLWNVVQTAGGLAAIVAAVIVFFSGWYAWIALLGNFQVWALGAAILNAIASAWNAVFTPDFWDDLLCWVYEAMVLADLEADQWLGVASWQHLISRLQADGRPAAQILAGLLYLGGAKWLSDMAGNGDNDGIGCNCDFWFISFGDDNAFGHVGIDLVEAQYQANVPYTLFAKPPEQYHAAEFTLWNRVDWDFTAAEITRITIRIRSVVNDPFAARSYNFYLLSDEFPAGENIFTGTWTDDATRILDTGLISRHNVTALNWQVTTRSLGNTNDRALVEIVAFSGSGATNLDD